MTPKRMKYYLNLLPVILISTLFSCSTPSEDLDVKEEKVAITFPERAKDMTIYEVNIRQFTPEGTFKAFEAHLPRLRELGIDMLWIMPIQPIGVKERKGRLGSYYAIQDYSKTNPEFGTMDDFKSLVDKAHELNMSIILDWVPNHTAWDHPWITNHPEYYAKDSTGKITYEADWSDIALLDHHNPETRKEMIKEMKFWVETTDIDGFRCDHAGHEIPLFFWEEAVNEIDPLKDLFWLAEWDQPRMHQAFHATYSWELLHLTEHVAKGEKNADDLHEFLKRDISRYGKTPFRMTIITNHDENSWAGTIEERYGEGHKAFAAFIFTAYGIPMLYSGQEAGLDKRLRFFDKDTINWEDPENFTSFYKKLVQVRKDNPALWSGEYGGMPEKIDVSNENVFAAYREKDDNQVRILINTSAEDQQITVVDKLVGTHVDYMTKESMNLKSGDEITLKPFQFHILIH